MTPMDWIGEVKSPAAGRQFGRSFNLLVKKCQGLKTTTQLIIPYTMIRIGVFIYDSEKKKKKKRKIAWNSFDPYTPQSFSSIKLNTYCIAGPLTPAQIYILFVHIKLSTVIKTPNLASIAIWLSTKPPRLWCASETLSTFSLSLTQGIWLVNGILACRQWK